MAGGPAQAAGRAVCVFPSKDTAVYFNSAHLIHFRSVTCD